MVKTASLIVGEHHEDRLCPGGPSLSQTERSAMNLDSLDIRPESPETLTLEKGQINDVVNAYKDHDGVSIYLSPGEDADPDDSTYTHAYTDIDEHSGLLIAFSEPVTRDRAESALRVATRSRRHRPSMISVITFCAAFVLLSFVPYDVIGARARILLCTVLAVIVAVATTPSDAKKRQDLIAASTAPS